MNNRITETEYMVFEMALVSPGEHMIQSRVYKRRSKKSKYLHINNELDSLPVDVFDDRKVRGYYEMR